MFGNPVELDTNSPLAAYNFDQGAGGGWGDMSLTDMGSLGIKGVGALSEILKGFSSMKANKLFQQQLDMAKDQFAFAKDMSNKNYSNSLRSFNNALQDRSNTRAFVEGRDQASADRYYEDHKLTGA